MIEISLPPHRKGSPGHKSAVHYLPFACGPEMVLCVEIMQLEEWERMCIFHAQMTLSYFHFSLFFQVFPLFC